MFNKKEAIQIVSKAAKKYKEKLEGQNLLFVYKDRATDKVCFFETIFLANNFQHLTGIEMINLKGEVVFHPKEFYDKCIGNKLKEDEIKFKDDGTTNMKLNAILNVVGFIDSSKITGLYNGTGIKLVVDRIVGTVSYCVGLTKDGDYYRPSSCLLEDTRNLVDSPSQVLAVLSKSAILKEQKYSMVRYVAKGVVLENLPLSEELLNLIEIKKG